MLSSASARFLRGVVPLARLSKSSVRAPVTLHFARRTTLPATLRYNSSSSPLNVDVELPVSGEATSHRDVSSSTPPQPTFTSVEETVSLNAGEHLNVDVTSSQSVAVDPKGDEFPKVYLSNVPYFATPNDIKIFLGQVEGVRYVHVGKRRDDRPAGWALVTMTDAEASSACIDYVGQHDFSGRTMRATHSQPRTTRGFDGGEETFQRRSNSHVENELIVSNVPLSVNEEEMKVYLESNGLEVTHMRFPFVKSTFTTKFIFLRFDNNQAANDAVEVLKNSPLNGQELSVRPLVATTKLDTTSVFITGLPFHEGQGGEEGFESYKEEISTLFQQVLSIEPTKINLHKFEDGSLRGSGHVQFSSSEEVSRVLETYNQGRQSSMVMGDSVVRVFESRPQRKVNTGYRRSPNNVGRDY